MNPTYREYLSEAYKEAYRRFGENTGTRQFVCCDVSVRVNSKDLPETLLYTRVTKGSRRSGRTPVLFTDPDTGKTDFLYDVHISETQEHGTRSTRIENRRKEANDGTA